jgi:hypothetical protein
MWCGVGEQKIEAHYNLMGWRVKIFTEVSSRLSELDDPK